MKKYLLGITLLATSGTLLAVEQADQFHAFNTLPQSTAAMDNQELDSVEGGYYYGGYSYSPVSIRKYTTFNYNLANVHQVNSAGLIIYGGQSNYSYISQR